MALGDNASTVAAKFASLSIPRQIGLLVGLAASIALGIAVALWSREPDYAPLYAQVSQRDSSEIVTALERYGILFKIEQSSVSPVFEKPAGTSKSPAGTKTGDKYASGGPGRPGPP